MQGIFAAFSDWWRKPFAADMDVPHWFFFLVLLTILMALWRIILTHVTES